MMRRKLTVEEKLKISALAKGGVRQCEIARELGIDVRQVRRFQRENSLPVPQNGLAQSVVEKICEMAKGGMAQNKIGRRLGINVLTVAKYLRLHQLPTHPAPFEVPGKLEEQVIRDLRHGLSQRKVAQRVGLSLFYVRKIGSRRAA
jgi:DNA invertase Pin-like site-specific DNA recombinase